MAIKKAFVEVVELLQANEGAVVADILPQVVELASAKSGGGGSKATAFHRDEEGNVVAIRCFYHGTWMRPSLQEGDGLVEFGKKANSATGLNSMCKEGVSKWTKQQRDAKKAKEALLEQVAAEEVPASELSDRLAEIEEARQAVEPFSGEDFETLEDLLATL